MNDKIGKMSGSLVWLFALGAVVLGIGGGYATAGLGAKVSSAVFFGVFAVAGYLGSLLTRASKGAAVAAMALASMLVAGTYYVVVSRAVQSAATSVGGAQAGGTMGAFFGIFIAAITLIATLVAGIGGAVAGASARQKAVGAR